MVIEGGVGSGFGLVVVAWIPLAIAGAQLLGGWLGSRGAKKASQQQQQVSREALAGYAPYAQAGGQGLTSLAALAGLPGAGGGAPADMMAQLQQSPGYQFRLGEGLKALERSAAARGTLLTGGTLKGLERYAQDYASDEYQKRFNQLAGLAQLGYGATGQQADLLTGAGNAAAAGTVGSANAWNQALSGAGNIGLQYWLDQEEKKRWKDLFGTGGAGGYYGDPQAYMPGVTPPPTRT